MTDDPNKTVLDLVNESIAHHERLRDGTNAANETIYWESCALCARFLSRGCAGCPISARTGNTACNNSPWVELAWAWSARDAARKLKASEKMLEFLESIRRDVVNSMITKDLASVE